MLATSGDERGDGATAPDRPLDDRDDGHLEDAPDGAGCTEIWEHIGDRDGGDG